MRGTVTTTIHPTRLTADERGTIQRAAACAGLTVSDLMRAASLGAAVRILSKGSV